MKICYINPTFLVRRPIAELIRLLNGEHEVALFMPKKAFKKLDHKWHSDKALKNAKIYSYSALQIPFLHFEWPIPITPMFFINLFRIFARYDVIHIWAYFYVNSLFTMFFKLFSRRTKVVMTSDTFPGYSFYPGFMTNIFLRIYTFIFGWFLFSIPDHVQIYGNSVIKYARKAGVPKKKIIVLPTGIDIEKFSKAEPIQRKELNLEKDDFVIFYAGLIVPRKGIDIMLKTVKMLSEKNKNVKLLLVGEGPNKKVYINMAKRMELEENVIFTSWRKDISNIMKTVDVLFLPSRGEGLPGIVMEAMAAKLPVVATDIPCTCDLVEDGKTGFLCEIDNSLCFSERIQQLIDNKTLKKEMGENSLKKIRDFDWHSLTKRYLELYKG